MNKKHLDAETMDSGLFSDEPLSGQMDFHEGDNCEVQSTGGCELKLRVLERQVRTDGMSK